MEGRLRSLGMEFVSANWFHGGFTIFHIFQNLSILFILSVLAEHSLAGSSRNFAKAWPIEYVSRLLSVILGISILNSRPFCISSIRMSTLLQSLCRASF